MSNLFRRCDRRLPSRAPRCRHIKPPSLLSQHVPTLVAVPGRYGVPPNDQSRACASQDATVQWYQHGGTQGQVSPASRAGADPAVGSSTRGTFCVRAKLARQRIQISLHPVPLNALPPRRRRRRLLVLAGVGSGKTRTSSPTGVRAHLRASLSPSPTRQPSSSVARVTGPEEMRRARIWVVGVGPRTCGWRSHRPRGVHPGAGPSCQQ